MRSTATRVIGGVVLSLVVFYGACASGESVKAAADSGVTAPADATVFTVQNNHADARDMVVYLQPEGRGERQRLGIVGSGQTQAFTHLPDRGYYVLIAAHNLGEVETRRFNITGPSTINWIMGTNRVVISRR